MIVKALRYSILVDAGFKISTLAKLPPEEIDGLINNTLKNNNPNNYHLWGVSSTFLMFYATNYDAFDYPDEERQIIENYYKEKAMKERLDRDGDGRPLLCPIKNPMELSKYNHRVNNCEI